MKNENNRDIIARRILWMLNEDGKKIECGGVVIYRPHSSETIGEFICPYEISILDVRKKKHSAGVDSFQALELVYRMINADLEYWKQCYGGNLCWGD